MKNTVLFFFAALITSVAIAQPALKQQKDFGGFNYDGLRSTCITRDGGTLSGGYSTSDSSGNKKTNTRGVYDMWIIKQDSTGKKQWERSIGGNRDEVLVDLKATPDGGYILAGFSTSGISGNKTSASKGGYDYWVVKVDSLGKVQWDKSLGGSSDDLGESVDLTKDGGYIVAGTTISPASGDITESLNGESDVWMVKLDAGGNIQWQNRLGGNGADGYQKNPADSYYGKNFRLAICRQATDGGYLMATSSSSDISGDKTQNAMGYSDYWVVKLDAAGNKLWDKTIGGSASDYIGDMAITADGGFIVAGYSNSPVSGNKTAGSKGGVDYWLVKLNGAGGIEWDKTIGGNTDDVPQSVLQTSDGGSYLIAGNSTSVISGDKTAIKRGMNDYWVVKTNNAGTVLWDKGIGGSDNDYATDVKQISPDSYIVSGESYSGISGNKTVVNYGLGDYWSVQLKETATAAREAITSNLLSNKQTANTKSFLAYPNPAVTVLHIQNMGRATFVLSDQSGKRKLSKTMNGNGDMNVAAIPTGTYYLTNTISGTTQKIIITK